MIKDMRKRLSAQGGFTLVELLIVIAILAVLMAALFLVINPVAIQQKSRDARRIAELGEFNKAMAAAIANGDATVKDFTSATYGCSSSSSAVDGTGWFGGISGTLTAFIPRLPRDPNPSSSGTQCYQAASNASAGVWEFDASLEYPGNASVMANDGGTNAGFYEVGTSLGLI